MEGVREMSLVTAGRVRGLGVRGYWKMESVLDQSLLWIQAGLGMKMSLQEKGETPACVTTTRLMSTAVAVVTHTVN